MQFGWLFSQDYTSERFCEESIQGNTGFGIVGVFMQLVIVKRMQFDN